MSNKINVEEILKKHINWFSEKNLDKSYSSESKVMGAIKEIVEAVVDKCAEEAEMKSYPYNGCSECGRDDMDIDKQSIFQVKQMINYGTD